VNLEAVIREALAGVGDASLGEWWDRRPHAIHCRRRLRPEEWGEQAWGQDLRGTAAGARRLATCRHWLPPDWSE
jgi:hypothetical protein